MVPEVKPVSVVPPEVILPDVRRAFEVHDMLDENEVPDDSDGAEARVELDMVPAPVVPTEPALPDVTDDWEVLDVL